MVFHTCKHSGRKAYKISLRAIVITKTLHSWNLSYPQAIELQKQLVLQVRICKLKKNPTLIAGIDCSFTKDNRRIIACVVVLKMPNLELIESKHAIRKITMPYIPGLLSFREAPACIAAVKKLRNAPNLFLIDGQGQAHPRRLGLASHLGLFFNTPTIGCAKSRLIGTFDEPPQEKGTHTPLKNKTQIIGAVLRTRSNVKPLFISVGHKCTLDDAIQWTLRCAVKYRLPEPTRLAHQFVTRLRLKA